MLRIAAIASLGVVAAGTAAADPRRVVLDAHGGIAFTGPTDEDPDNPELEVGPVVGASLAWDSDPPPYPTTPGTRSFDGELVPELSLYGIARDAFVLGGVRLELEVAEYKVGLLGISSRTSLWIAPKLGVTTRERTTTPVAGGELGAQFVLKSGWRIGYWLGVYAWKQERLPCACLARDDEMLYADGDHPIVHAQIGLTVGNPL